MCFRFYKFSKIASFFLSEFLRTVMLHRKKSILCIFTSFFKVCMQALSRQSNMALLQRPYERKRFHDPDGLSKIFGYRANFFFFLPVVTDGVPTAVFTGSAGT